MWKFDYTQATTAPAEQIWAYYAATDLAPTWDPLVRRIEVNGPFAAGTRGRNHPQGGGNFPFEYTEVVTNRSYTEVTRVPLARMAFTHVITPTASGCEFVQGVIISGPLAWLYTILFRRSFAQGLPQAAQNLARLAEEHPLPLATATPSMLPGNA